MRAHDSDSSTTEDLVDVDPYTPEKPPATIPVYKRNEAPEGLATKRQLRDMGLRPGGQQVVAEVESRGPRNGFLYEIALAKPVRPMTLAKEFALDQAMAARQTCPECHEGTPADPTSYLNGPASPMAA